MSVDELKDQGNKAFDAGDYDKAIDLYTQAIAFHPQHYVLFSDRSAAYARKNQWAKALTDAERCIELNPAGWEGFACKGAALHGAGRYAEAIVAYEEGLKLEDRPALRHGLRDVQDTKADDDENTRPEKDLPLALLTPDAVPVAEEARVEDEHAHEEPGNGGEPTGAEPGENKVEAQQPKRGDGSDEAGGDGGGDEPATITVDDKWESPVHRTVVHLRIKLDATRTYKVSIGYTLKFIIDRNPKKPTNITESVSQSEVSALVDFWIETAPRETQIDRSYASIGFLAHRKKSISDQEFLHPGSGLLGKIQKYGKQKQIPKRTFRSWMGAMSAPLFSAVDGKVMQKCSVYAESGQKWHDNEKSYSSFNITYQCPDMELDSARADFDHLEFKVGMGINLRPSGSETPLPKMSFINRNQVLIWVWDPKSKAQIRGIIVLMSSVLDDICIANGRSILEEQVIELGNESLPERLTGEDQGESVSLSIAQVAKQSPSKFRMASQPFFKKARQLLVTPPVDVRSHEYLARGWDANKEEWKKVLWPALDKDFRAAQVEETVPVWQVQFPPEEDRTAQEGHTTRAKTTAP